MAEASSFNYMVRGQRSRTGRFLSSEGNGGVAEIGNSRIYMDGNDE